MLGVELMLNEIVQGKTGRDQGWNTGKLEKPFGRGINPQFDVESVDTVYHQLEKAKWPIFLPIHDAWYRRNELELGNRQFLVLDPDGYQLRPFTSLGERKLNDLTGCVRHFACPF